MSSSEPEPRQNSLRFRLNLNQDVRCGMREGERSTSTSAAKKLKARYLALHDLAFLDKGVNPLFLGHPGTGKTFLARALAYRACQAARWVIFTSTPKMLNELTGAEIHGMLDKAMRRYVKADLLVLDDLAVLVMDPAQAKLAFQVISERLTERCEHFVFDGKSFRPHAS